MKIENIDNHRGKFFMQLQLTPRSETGVMTIAPGGEGGPPEKHTCDQVFLIVDGQATVTVDDKKYTVAKGDAFTVPKDVIHHVKNDGDTDLFFFTVYAPTEE